MDQAITIAPFDAAYIPGVDAWAGQGAVSALLKLPASIIPQNPAAESRSWVALVGKVPIAIATISLDNMNVGYLNVMVKPSERRKGVGGHLTEYVLNQPITQELGHLRAQVELDNIAAQKILTNHGFSRTGYASEGQLEFEKH